MGYFVCSFVRNVSGEFSHLKYEWGIMVGISRFSFSLAT